MQISTKIVSGLWSWDPGFDKAIPLQYIANMNIQRTNLNILVLLTILWVPSSVIAETPSPVEIPQGWQRIGPFGGTVVDVEFAPANPDIIYCLLHNDAFPIYRSEDKGITWTPIPFPYDIFYSEDIAVSPIDPDILLFSTADSLSRTCDGGDTWTMVQSSNPGFITFDPSDGNVVYVAGGRAGLARSEDGGITWTKVSDNSLFKVTVDPFDSNHLLGNEAYGLLESHDSGHTWGVFDFVDID